MTDRLGGDGFIGELATALSFISGERKSSGSKVERASEVFRQQASKEEISAQFGRRYLAPNIFRALLKFNSFPEWVEVLSTVEISYTLMKKKERSLSQTMTRLKNSSKVEDCSL